MQLTYIGYYAGDGKQDSEWMFVRHNLRRLSMSTLRTNTLTGTTSAGSILVTGEGGSTTTNLQQGLNKVLVNYMTQVIVVLQR